MTSGTTDLPKPGHVLRYVYLFAEEAARGRDEGVKERFVVVGGVLGRRYRVAAITTKGEGKTGSLLLPAPVATAAGVAVGSSVVVSEFNRFTWPGFDIRPLSKKTGYIAGRLPPGFTNTLIDALIGATPVERD
ncbi:hypothetical protein [Croceicoccus marinus]|uniref:Growth inhibitor PemK n=1 Tax=Croceicoccus marinus TaxID=450378 RepID=A0A7G6W136_9SPHN|nr:hypothetical protein [Croceicoccus marinus]QNE07701.1 hypothetical protein H4O24_19950 [Croceicoccus marinus]